MKDGSRITRYSPFRTEGREKGKKYPGGVRVGGGTLLTSLNMFQHPSATRSIASLSVDTDARQAKYPPALSTSPFPLPLPILAQPQRPAPPIDHLPIPSSPPPCFLPPTLRVTSVADRPQPPASPLSPTLDSLVLPQPSRPPSFQWRHGVPYSSLH